MILCVSPPCMRPLPCFLMQVPYNSTLSPVLQRAVLCCAAGLGGLDVAAGIESGRPLSARARPSAPPLLLLLLLLRATRGHHSAAVHLHVHLHLRIRFLQHMYLRLPHLLDAVNLESSCCPNNARREVVPS